VLGKRLQPAFAGKNPHCDFVNNLHEVVSLGTIYAVKNIGCGFAS